MSDNANLDNIAASIMLDAIYGMTQLDMPTLRDAAHDLAISAADSATTYTSDALEIISRYERDAGSEVDDLCSDAQYSAAQWRDAMTAYAFAIARSIIDQQVDEALDEIEAAADTLADAAMCCGADDVGDPRVTSDCPHGWAPHDREDADGVHYWSPANLEGCHAVAIHVAGIWLSYTWTPAAD